MRRLGLDIGTNSIGWCLTEDDRKIVDIGVRIFSDGREAPKSGSVGAPLAEKRRLARGARRRRDRYLGRRSAFLEALVAYGLMPADADEAKVIAKLDPYMLRARALDEKLQPYEIGRALFHLNQRRGFKSNRKAERKQKDNKEGVVESGRKALDAKMAEAEARTLGEFLAGRLASGKEARVRMGGESQEYDFYPQRHHVLDEFRAIWDAQKPHHPKLLTDEAFKATYRIIEFQRDLKDQIVGVCTFAGLNGVPSDEKRLPKWHPLFQQRRLLEEVNHLRITRPGEIDRPLKRDERDALILKLRDKKTVRFETLRKRVLKLHDGERFNKESENRKELAGDEVRAEMSARFGPRWAHLSLAERVEILDKLVNEGDRDTLLAWLNAKGLDDQTASLVAGARLPEGYGRFGETASRALIEELARNVITFDKAALAAGFHHSDFRTGEELKRLPYYGELLSREIAPGKDEYGDKDERRWGKITNPTVHIGLRQLEKLVNAVIEVHGRPDQIVVELARALKLNEKQRDEHIRRIRENTAAAQQRSKDLEELEQHDTGANRALLRIWEELSPDSFLDRACPYCGETISPTMLFDGQAQVDHVIPYSKCLDDSFANKVVVHRRCNQQKGNQTPWDAWGRGRDPERWEKISAQVARLHKSKQWRFGPDAMERVNGESGFLARQLTDTQYLSRLAGQYLSSLYTPDEGRRVYVIPGRMTAMLRRLWALNDVLDDSKHVENKHSNAPKNRLDHRHHAIDGFVCSVTSQSLLMRIAEAAGRAEDKDLDRLFEGLPEPWPGYLNELRDRLKAVTVSHKPDHGRKGKPAPGRDVTAGRLHDDTAYGLTGRFGPDGKTPEVVSRKPFLSLKPKDVCDPDRIRDDALRIALYRATEGLEGKAFEQALADFAKQDPVFKGIRRVRVLGEQAGSPTLDVIPIKNKDGKVYKAYKGNSNARFEVWRLPEGKWQSHTVPTFDAHQTDQQPYRPHPAAKRILNLRQNDLIAIERDGGARELMRVVKFAGSGQVTLAAHNEGGALKARDAASNELDPFKYISPTAGGLKKIKARQVRIDPLGRIFDPGPR